MKLFLKDHLIKKFIYRIYAVVAEDAGAKLAAMYKKKKNQIQNGEAYN